MLSPGAKRRLTDNPALFLLHYFPHRIKELKSFHLDLIEAAAFQRRSITLYPATHGKTTLLSELLPIWALSRDPNIRIANILKNEADARAVTRAIMNELVTNEALIEDFGPFRDEDDDSKIWTQSRFDVARRSKRSKSATYAAFGAGSRNALGYRTDWTILDDCVTDKNSSTAEQRQNLREWFNQGPVTMPDREEGHITIVGTAFHPEDLYHDLMRLRGEDDKPMWKTTVKRAVLDAEKQIVLWPEERPWSFLMEQKATMGTLDFNKRFQNVAVDPSGLVFREEYVRGGIWNHERFPGCLDPDFKIGDCDGSWQVYCGFDPAIGVTRSKKFCAHITLAVGSCQKHDRCLWVVDLKRDQMTLPRQVDLILDQHETYGAVKSVIEMNGYQAGLYQAVRDKMDRQGRSMNIEPHYTNRINKPDPHAGVSAMGTMVEQGRLHIPWGDAASRTAMTLLVDEMVTYPDGKTTDCVMGLWFAWRASSVTAPRFRSFNRLQTEQRTFPPLQPVALGMRRVVNPYYLREE